MARCMDACTPSEPPCTAGQCNCPASTALCTACSAAVDCACCSPNLRAALAAASAVVAAARARCCARCVYTCHRCSRGGAADGGKNARSACRWGGGFSNMPARVKFVNRLWRDRAGRRRMSHALSPSTAPPPALRPSPASRPSWSCSDAAMGAGMPRRARRSRTAWSNARAAVSWSGNTPRTISRDASSAASALLHVVPSAFTRLRRSDSASRSSTVPTTDASSLAARLVGGRGEPVRWVAEDDRWRIDGVGGQKLVVCRSSVATGVADKSVDCMLGSSSTPTASRGVRAVARVLLGGGAEAALGACDPRRVCDVVTLRRGTCAPSKWSTSIHATHTQPSEAAPTYSGAPGLASSLARVACMPACTSPPSADPGAAGANADEHSANASANTTPAACTPPLPAQGLEPTPRTRPACCRAECGI